MQSIESSSFRGVSEKEKFFLCSKRKSRVWCNFGNPGGLKGVGDGCATRLGWSKKRRGEGEEAGWVELFAPRVIGDERDRE